MLPVLLDRRDHAKTSCAFIKLKPKEFHKTFSRGGYPEVTMHVERSSQQLPTHRYVSSVQVSATSKRGEFTSYGASFSVLQSGRIFR